ncbi:signal peptide protein [Rhodopirellula maiorica SM1]|uniref:Signal peptide protein n=1 Tax=Rhodopirellula maiorica SM1 TaxID=1265738 RepID=M5RW08_9BACT|nr:hypothetical protein [Rhodopirellula maiorica]EMI18139.1 signal peptide protein [Rhodopirellula maiorica SM1]
MMRTRHPLFHIAMLLVLACLFCQMGHRACAQDANDKTQSSFSENVLPSTVWFDPDERKIVPVRVQTSLDDTEHRDSRWLPKAKQVAKKSTPAAPTTPTATTTNGLFGTDLTLGNLFAWMLLAAIVAGLVGTLIYALSKADIDLNASSKSAATDEQAGPDEQTIERMKHLPAELRRTDVNLRSEAARLMSLGQYDQAVILLFAHQLLLLDRSSLIRLNRGKTNGKYVRECRAADAELGSLLKETTTAFERSYFGRQQIIDSEFRDLWNQNETLERKVQSHHEVAA